jgi:hypothetical protein
VREANRSIGEMDWVQIEVDRPPWAWRRTLLVSGLEHPNVVKLVAQITDEGRAKGSRRSQALSA